VRDYRVSIEESTVADEATYFLLGEVPWPETEAEGAVLVGAPAPPESLVEAARRAGARRKFLARGQGGFFSQYSEFSAGFTVPPHFHDHSEIFVILEGSATMSGGGPTLHAHDSMVLMAGYEYGFTAGPDGMKAITIRTGVTSTTLT
jgi:quercetin dioxygenase-like cupin family protein